MYFLSLELYLLLWIFKFRIWLILKISKTDRVQVKSDIVQLEIAPVT